MLRDTETILELGAARGAAVTAEQEREEDAAEEGIADRVWGLGGREVEPAERRADAPYMEA